jgi:hypothetical protein
MCCHGHGHCRLLAAAGVAITLTSPDGGNTLTTSTQLDGRFALEVPGPGSYRVKGELAAFAPATKDITVGPVGPGCSASVNLALTLASRTAGAAPVEVRPIAAQRVPAAGQFQRLAPVADATGAKLQEQGLTGAAAESTETVVAHLSLPPGFSPDNLSETVAAFGSTGQTNNAVLFGGFREGMGLGMMGTADLFGGGAEGQPGMGLPGMGQGVPGMGARGRAAAARWQAAPGGWARGTRRHGRPWRWRPRRAWRGGPAGLWLAGAGRPAQNNRPRGQFSQPRGSPLDASPYSLTGQPVTTPQYLQQRFAGRLWPFKIPKLFDAGPRTAFFLNYSGNRSSNLYTSYSTVPTAALRTGDLSLVPTPVIDPLTGQPFPGNQIPANRISPSALALLQYIPPPTQEGDRKNFYHSTTNGTSSDDVNFRFIRSFGTTTRGPGQRGPAGGGGGRGSGGRGGGQGGAVNLNFGIHYQRSESAQNNPFPAITGTSHRTAWDVPVTVSFSKWGIQHSLNFDFNRSNSQTLNAFAYLQNVAGDAGILGVSNLPFDWGVPNISFSTFTGLRDINPALSHNQTLSFSDSMVKMKGRHSFRFCGDFRDVRVESRSDASARGSYVFTGLYTGIGAGKASGLDFADFLLGLAQQASVQYGPGLEQLRTRSWSLYVQDDWRVRTNFTVNAGVRYEYQSPYWSATNQIVNLDVAPDFTAAVPVQPGQTGPYTGVFPSTLINPDRNNFSPRIGIAWRPLAKTIVRGMGSTMHRCRTCRRRSACSASRRSP